MERRPPGCVGRAWSWSGKALTSNAGDNAGATLGLRSLCVAWDARSGLASRRAISDLIEGGALGLRLTQGLRDRVRYDADSRATDTAGPSHASAVVRYQGFVRLPGRS